ncbi:sensor histidine kinase [Methanobacterium oryzae]|uniref:sensor histidine kinase n=1 Tax=Methanobacterium oryzae TaxID=69540 RepID=UPI003D1B48C3
MQKEYKSKKEYKRELKSPEKGFNELKSNSNYIKNLEYELELKNKILDRITDPIFVYDLKGNFIYVNEAFCSHLNYSRDELIEKNIHDLDIREFSELFKPNIQELFKNDEYTFQCELKDDFEVFREMTSKIIEINDEKLIFNIFCDLTAHKKIEKLIRDREKHLSLITNNMLDLIYQVDKLGCFQYVSPSIKDLLGYEPEDLIGKQDLELINMVHPDDLGLLIDAVQTCIVTLKPGRAQHRFRHIDGHYIWVETIGNPLIDENREFAGAVYITRDITELKNVENQLKSSINEKELLLREVHHRVKNNMQIISSILNLQSAHLKDKIALNTLRESQNRVKSMAIVHEELYQSNDLSKIDFAEYMKRLVAELFNSYGVSQKVIKSKISAQNIFLDIDTAIHCGLIINELVSNSLKHAFPLIKSTEDSEFKKNTTKGEINIEFYLDDDHHTLLIEDNGIGFPEDIDPQNTKTLGLKLVNTLVYQLSGEIKINTEKGSSFKIIF